MPKFIPQFQIEEQPKIPIFGQLGILAGMLLLIFGSGYVPKVLDTISKSTDIHETNESVALPIKNEVAYERSNSFEDIVIQAEAAFVWDVQNQVALYQKNDYEQMPLASVTKLMTALVAHEILSEEAKIPVTVAAILQDGNSGLREGESFTLFDILNLTLLSSSNDGAYAIAAAVGSTLSEGGGAHTFVQAMNIRASELGLNQTYFKNPTGLDISATEGGAYGSARDVAYLVEYILKKYPRILEHTKMESAQIGNITGETHNVENTNPTVDRIAGLIGSKTGYTELAGGNLAIAFDAAYNRPIIVVVLGSTYTARFEDVLTLTAAARNAIK